MPYLTNNVDGDIYHQADLADKFLAVIDKAIALFTYLKRLVWKG